MSILDIKAVDENGVWYDIEMQISEQEFYENDLKSMMVRNAEIQTAERKGRQKGILEGREEGILEGR